MPARKRRGREGRELAASLFQSNPIVHLCFRLIRCFMRLQRGEAGRAGSTAPVRSYIQQQAAFGLRFPATCSATQTSTDGSTDHHYYYYHHCYTTTLDYSTTNCYLRQNKHSQICNFSTKSRMQADEQQSRE